MGFSGDLTTFQLADIFQSLTNNQQTGTLHIHDDKTDQYIFFSHGMVRSVSSGKRRGIPLGQLLLTRGIVTQEQLDHALRQEQASEFRLGEVLVREGFCTEEDIKSAVRFQIQEAIYDLFSWKEAKFDFSEGGMATAIFGKRNQTSEVEVPTASLLMEAARRLDEWGRITDLLPSIHMVLTVIAEIPAMEDRPPEQDRILELVADGLTIESIIRKSAMGRYTVTQVIATYLREGYLREATDDEMLAFAEAKVLAGAPDLGAEIYHRLIEKNGEDESVRQLQGEALEASGCPEEAAAAYIRLAEIRGKQGRYAPAIEAYEHAGRLHALTPQQSDRLAELYVVDNREQEAAQMWLMRSQTLLNRKDLTGALATCEKAVGFATDSIDLYSLLARIRLEIGDTKGAVAAYEELARIHEQRSDTSSQLAAFRSILHIDASRSDLRSRIKVIQAQTARGRTRRKYTIALSIAGVILLVVLGGVAIQEVNTRKDFNAFQSDYHNSLLQAEGIKEAEARHIQLSQLQEEVQAFTPPFSLSDYSPELNAMRHKVTTALRDAQKALSQQRSRELERNRTEYESCLTLLKANTRENRAKAVALLQALSRRSPADRWIEAAQAKLKALSAETDQAKQLYEAIGKLTFDRAARFQKTRTLIESYPDSEYTSRVTVPVALRTDPVVTAKVLLDGKLVGTLSAKRPELVLDLPPVAPFTVTVVRPGFGDARGNTPWQATKFLSPTHTVNLKRAQSWDADLKAAVVASPLLVVGDPTLPPQAICGTSDGQVSAYHLKTGIRLWHFDGQRHGFDFRSSPYRQKDGVLLLDQSGRVISLSLVNGRPVGKLPEGDSGYQSSSLTTQPLFTQLQLFRSAACIIGSASGELVCLESATNRVMWKERVGEGASLMAPPALGPQGFFLPAPDNKLYWLGQSGKTLATQALQGICTTRITVQGKTLYTVTEQGVVSAIPVSGKAPPKWHSRGTQGPTSCPLLATPKRLFLGLEDRRVIALSPRSGKILWKQEMMPGPITVEMVVQGTDLLVASGNALVCLNQENGTIRWQQRMGDPLLTGLSATEGDIVVANEKGGL
ncbi:MAG: DUF4388 domain-containing protein [Planctomycetota bacterium]|jgi:outer membrane protein assembly factor BamB/tetratricopeptide (TPR) repeat protein